MKPVTETIADAWGVPKEAVMNIAKITLSQNREIFIERHNGIKEYGETTVRVSLPKNVLLISGKELRIAALSPDAVRITGNIQKIEFEL